MIVVMNKYNVDLEKKRNLKRSMIYQRALLALSILSAFRGFQNFLHVSIRLILNGSTESYPHCILHNVISVCCDQNLFIDH